MKTNKKGFTIVELTIVIAVIAILAAVLIPTFVSLVKKANNSAALADARNMANQLLINLMDKDGAESRDLIVIQEKTDGIYVHAYCTSEGKFVAYKGNPITDATGDDFNAKVDNILTQLQSAAVLVPNTVADEENWAHPNNMATIVETLGYNPENTAFRADYKVELVAFEKQNVPAEHICAGNLEKRDGQTPDCVHAGWDTYYICTVCGKAWNDENATTAFTLKVKDPTEDHDFTVPMWDKVYHWNACSRCGECDTQTAHNLSHTVSGSSYIISCSGEGCSYKLEGNEVPKAYQEAIKLNAILENTNEKHTTMHSAFEAIVTNGTYANIAAVIEEIGQHENVNGMKILWDQSIDRFVVVEEDGSYVNVVYSPSTSGLRGGDIGMYHGTYLLWDTYDTEIPKKDNQLYSIYWAGENLPDYFKYNNTTNSYDLANFKVGLDMGSYELTEGENIKINFAVGNGGYEIPVIFNIQGTINLTIAEFGKVAHYGKIDTLTFGYANSWDGDNALDYYEYGSVSTVSVSTKSDNAPYIDVTVHLMPGSNISDEAKSSLGTDKVVTGE